VKVLFAPDKFKGTLSAKSVANALAEGLRETAPEVEAALCPAADGGEGTLEALVEATGGRYLTRKVLDPFGSPVQARFGIIGPGRAVVEMAQASGIALVPSDMLDPMRASTFGTGELISAALDEGCREVIVGIGGSATVDGGAGMAAALGARLLDAAGHPIPPGGAGLCRLALIDDSTVRPQVAETRFAVASDVTNPLLGPEGAARVYGPQKGANPAEVEQLEACLSRYADVLERDLAVDVRRLEGAGAAGGLGAGLIAFLRARLRSGVEVVLEALDFESRLAGVDLVVTGEGCVDAQTAAGKTPVGVARAAKRHGIRVLCVTGRTGPGAEAVLAEGVDEIIAIAPELCSLEESMAAPEPCLKAAGRRIGTLLAVEGQA